MSMEFAVFYYLKYTNTYGLVFMAESKAAFVDKKYKLLSLMLCGFLLLLFYSWANAMMSSTGYF